MRIAISMGLLTGMMLITTANAEEQKDRALSLLKRSETIYKILKFESGNDKLIPIYLRALDPVAVDSQEDTEEIEVDISMEDLPKAVRKTLKRESRGGEIEEIELQVEGDKIVYEAEVVYKLEDRELEYDIRISLDGILLSKLLVEDESDDEEDQEDQDEEKNEDNSGLTNGKKVREHVWKFG